jgi:hypothetical protein
MTYDSSRQRVILFGGAAGTPLRDTWTWDGNTWKREELSADPRLGEAAANATTYDSARRSVLTFQWYSESSPGSALWKLSK